MLNKVTALVTKNNYKTIVQNLGYVKYFNERSFFEDDKVDSILRELSFRKIKLPFVKYPLSYNDKEKAKTLNVAYTRFNIIGYFPVISMLSSLKRFKITCKLMREEINRSPKSNHKVENEIKEINKKVSFKNINIGLSKNVALSKDIEESKKIIKDIVSFGVLHFIRSIIEFFGFGSLFLIPDIIFTAGKILFPFKPEDWAVLDDI